MRAVHPLIPADKVELGLAARLAGDAGSGVIDSLVLFFGDVAPSDAEAVLQANGVAGRRDGESSTYLAPLIRAQVHALAREDAVQFVAAAPESGRVDLDVSRDLINVDELQQFKGTNSVYEGLSGLGVQIGIHDSGVDDHHLDFDGRMIKTLIARRSWWMEELLSRPAEACSMGSAVARRRG